MQLNLALGGVDGRGNGLTQIGGGQRNAGANNGQDQSIFSRRSARFVANKSLEEIAHLKTPLVTQRARNQPLRRPAPGKMGRRWCTGSAPLRPVLDLALSGVDGGRDRLAQVAGGQCDAGADNGQDQSIFGRGSARFVADERLEEITHVQTPLLQCQTASAPSKTDAELNDAPRAICVKACARR